MNAVVTRRALLGATAAVSVAALPAMAGAADIAPDTELHAALDRWEAITAERPAMEAALDAAMDRAQAAYPPRPATLNMRGIDARVHLLASATGFDRLDGERGRFFYDHDDVEKMRAGPPVTRWAMVGDDVDPPPREPNPRGEARRLEIIAAYDDWIAAREAVDCATGYSALNGAWEALMDELNAAEDRIKACAPRTVAGLRRKAVRVADLLERDASDDDLAAIFARQVADFGEAAA